LTRQAPRVREATPADVPSIASILREIGWFPGVDEGRIEDNLLLCASDGSHDVLVSTGAADAAVGYVVVHWLPGFRLMGTEGYVSDLFVLPERQGRGNGRALLDAVRELALARGCVRLSLLNSRERPSFERDYYARLGWQRQEEVADFVLWLDRGPSQMSILT
jgi:GNAT superfamily N-acetyltransferase